MLESGWKRVVAAAIAAAIAVFGSPVFAGDPPAPSLHGAAGHVVVAPGAATPARDVTIVGSFDYTAPIVARTVTIRDATIRCAAGKPVIIKASRIVWEGVTRFDCAGKPGANGANGVSYKDAGWCAVEGQSPTWEADFNSGGNEAGGNGSNGEDGTDGSDVIVTARSLVFADGAKVRFETEGGGGGAAGIGGIGKSKASAPSGDDCRHGTRLRNHRKAPDGVNGMPGRRGATGTVRFSGMNDGKFAPEIVVNAATPTTIAPRASAKVNTAPEKSEKTEKNGKRAPVVKTEKNARK